MGLIKWLFGMNLSEEDLEHNRRIDERERFEREAVKWVKTNYPKWYVGSPKWNGSIMEAVKLYRNHIMKEKEIENRIKNSDESFFRNSEKKKETINNEIKAKSKLISIKQKQNIPLTKDELEFMNNYNNKNIDSNNNPNLNDQNKSKLELELAIKQKELELLKLRAQMEKEKN